MYCHDGVEESTLIRTKMIDFTKTACILLTCQMKRAFLWVNDVTNEQKTDHQKQSRRKTFPKPMFALHILICGKVHAHFNPSKNSSSAISLYRVSFALSCEN